MFQVAEEIQSSSTFLGDWPLSRVFLKNDKNIPWFLLVPRKENIREMFELAQEDRQQLMEEINQLSNLVRELYQPYKLNVGWLGNMVSQLHVHVLGRNPNDALWPVLRYVEMTYCKIGNKQLSFRDECN